MVKKQSSSGRYVQPYRYPSPNIPMSAIRRFARKIAERFHPEKIILFGSYAYGTPHEESDVDLLVIMPAKDPVNQSIRIGEEFEWPFSLDLFVRTPKQIELGLRQQNQFLKEVTHRGKTLYDAGHSKMGAVRRRRLARGKRTGQSKATSSGARVLSLPAIGREVFKGNARGVRRSHSKNPQSQ